MTHATGRRIAILLAVLSVAFMGAQVWLRQAFPEARGSIDGLSLLPMVLALAAVGGLIAARRPDNAYGWIVLGAGFAWSTNGLSVDYAALAVARELPAAHFAAVLAAVTASLAWGLFVTFGLLLYPTGRVPTPRWRWVAWVAGAGVAFMTLGLTSAAVRGDAETVLRQFREGAETTVFGVPRVLNEIGHVGTFFGMFAGVVSLIVRARRAGSIERLQLKWFGFGAVLVALSIFVQFGPLAEVLSWLEIVSMTAMPIVIGIAITRWHLYDIDRIFSRTLSYALLTVLLVGIYLGAVTTLTALTAPVTGESPLAVAAATLLAAAAFQPARRRIQSVVDRRFNRARYNARHTVEAFAGQLRQEVDLDDVQSHLVATVDTVLQPAQVGVWLRPGAMQ